MATEIVLADDHRLVRHAVAQMIERSGMFAVVAECQNGDEALDAIRAHAPKVAVLDVSMPKKSGLAVARIAQSEKLGCAIVLLTMHADCTLVQRAHELDVLGVVLKDDAPDDLLHALKSAVDGRRFVSAALTRELIDDPRGAAQLTRREREVVEHVARGLTGKQIGAALGISPRTVETHRARVMAKLNAESTADLVRFAIRVGLIDA